MKLWQVWLVGWRESDDGVIDNHIYLYI